MRAGPAATADQIASLCSRWIRGRDRFVMMMQRGGRERRRGRRGRGDKILVQTHGFFF